MDRIHQTREEKVDAPIINPAAFTPTSVALRDALVGVTIPFVGTHITHVHSREAFKHHCYLSLKVEAVIMGMGGSGYSVRSRLCSEEAVAQEAVLKEMIRRYLACYHI